MNGYIFNFRTNLKLSVYKLFSKVPSYYCGILGLLFVMKNSLSIFHIEWIFFVFLSAERRKQSKIYFCYPIFSRFASKYDIPYILNCFLVSFLSNQVPNFWLSKIQLVYEIRRGRGTFKYLYYVDPPNFMYLLSRKNIQSLKLLLNQPSGQLVRDFCRRTFDFWELMSSMYVKNFPLGLTTCSLKTCTFISF